MEQIINGRKYFYDNVSLEIVFFCSGSLEIVSRAFVSSKTLKWQVFLPFFFRECAPKGVMVPGVPSIF